MAATSGNTEPLMIGAANVGPAGDNSAAGLLIENGDGTTEQTAFTAPAGEGSKLFSLNVTSDDTTDPVNIQVFLNDGSNSFLLGTVPVATLSGTDGATPSVNILSPAYIAGLDASDQLLVPAGWTVKVAPLAAVTAAKTVTVIALGGDY